MTFLISKMSIESLSSKLNKSNKKNGCIQEVESLTQGYNIVNIEKPTFDIQEEYKKYKTEMNNFDVINDYAYPVKFKNNSFLMLCMHLLDKSTSVYRLCDAIDKFANFKKQLITDIPLKYKKYGLNRRKTINQETMTAELASDENDELMIKPEHMIFLSRWTDHNFCIIDFTALERTDYMCGNPDAPNALFKFFDNEWALYVGEKPVHEKIQDDLNMMKCYLLTSVKKNDQKKLAKLIAPMII